MTDDAIIEACLAHGAKRVYDAAYRCMTDGPAALAAFGLDATNILEMDRVGRVAYRLRSPIEQAADLADVAIQLAKL